MAHWSPRFAVMFVSCREGTRGSMAIALRTVKDSQRKLISKARNRKDDRRLLRVVFEFLAEAGYVDVDCPREGFGAVAPDFFQDFVARNRRSAMFDEIAKQLKFAGGKRDDFAVFENLCSTEVDANRAELANVFLAWRTAWRPAQQCLDAGHQF